MATESGRARWHGKCLRPAAKGVALAVLDTYGTPLSAREDGDYLPGFAHLLRGFGGEFSLP